MILLLFHLILSSVSLQFSLPFHLLLPWLLLGFSIHLPFVDPFSIVFLCFLLLCFHQSQLCLPLHILEERGLPHVARTVSELLELAPPRHPSAAATTGASVSM